ncbi:hypothetical protein [Geodermatophilus sabuli]|uniref:Uncharacterized protein n=1 Tax=Geodermatophilus sabuli TaxID=1564158 RepID=A0A285EGG5_9ACTN|nr:hypothetical protein [Geodermatophilus sabuli]MBB3082945.1 prophage DNA circulation protein [Geodermatophilus sabuli]SNX97943.1 hypothetical protein SAMN06893097_10923 [Geodermatophilus sabuli]
MRAMPREPSERSTDPDALLRAVSTELDALTAVVSLTAETDWLLARAFWHLKSGPEDAAAMAAAHRDLTTATNVLTAACGHLDAARRCARWPMDHPHDDWPNHPASHPKRPQEPGQ